MNTPDTESSFAALDDDGVWPLSFEEDEMTWLHREGDEASKALLPLVDGTATKLVWASSDVELPYLAPWEALMIALLFDGPASAGAKTRRDVAIAVHVARILQIPYSLRLQNPVVAAGPHGWIYRQVYIQSLSIGEDLDVLDYHQRSRRPSRFTTAIHGVLPRTKVLNVKWFQALVDAMKGNHTDIFVLAATYGVASGSLVRNDASASEKAWMLKAVLQNRHHQLFLSVLPLHFLIDHDDRVASLRAVASYPALFKQVVDQLTAAGVDLAPEAERLLQGLPAAQKWNIGETLINLYRPSSETEFFAVFKSVLLECHVRMESFITSVKRQHFVSTHHERWGDVLKQVLRPNPQKSDGIALEMVRTLVDQCPALGFDLELAMKSLIERRSALGCLEGVNMSCFRYVFLDSLGMDRVRRLLTPLELVQWVRSGACLQLMVDNGFPLPGHKSPECAELAKAVMLLFKGNGWEFFVDSAGILQVMQVDLNKEALTECLAIMCEGLFPATFHSNECGSRARCALLCLQYFVAKGSLTSDFRFPNGDGLQHRIGFGGGGGFYSRSDVFVALELIRYLQVDLNLDFTEVNPATGKFPLSLALERGDAISAVQLLKQKLYPSKDVLLGYRYGSHTLLTMLFYMPTGVGPGPQLGRQFCESIGIEVARELAKVKVSVRRPGFGGKDTDVVSMLPLELACWRWPREELAYLIDELKLEGLDGETCEAVINRLRWGTAR
jgi:hypothetical protein